MEHVRAQSFETITMFEILLKYKENEVLFQINRKPVRGHKPAVFLSCMYTVVVHVLPVSHNTLTLCIQPWTLTADLLSMPENPTKYIR